MDTDPSSRKSSAEEPRPNQPRIEERTRRRGGGGSRRDPPGNVSSTWSAWHALRRKFAKTNWLALLGALSIMLGFGFGGSLWMLFRSHLARRQSAERYRKASEKHRQDKETLQRAFRQKTDQLHSTLDELKHQVGIAKQAIHHNNTLKQIKRQLEVNVAERTEDLRAANDAKEKMEKKLVNVRQRIGELESRVVERDQQVEMVQIELKEAKQLVKDLEARTDELRQELNDREKSITNLNTQIQMASENQQVLEYVLGRFSPELAKKVAQAMKLHREQRNKLQQQPESASLTPPEERHMLDRVASMEQTPSQMQDSAISNVAQSAITNEGPLIEDIATDGREDANTGESNGDR